MKDIGHVALPWFYYNPISYTTTVKPLSLHLKDIKILLNDITHNCVMWMSGIQSLFRGTDTLSVPHSFVSQVSPSMCHSLIRHNTFYHAVQDIQTVLYGITHAAVWQNLLSDY